MQSTIIERTMQTGKQVKINVESDDRACFYLAGYLDGNLVTKGNVIDMRKEHNWPAWQKALPEGWRHTLAGKIALSPDEAVLCEAHLVAAREDAAQAKQDALTQNVPGLDILRAAKEAWSDYHAAFEAMMDDEHNDGARPPQKPEVKIEEIARQYPRAALYLRAESYTYSNNTHKYGAGKEAMKLIVSGSTLEEANHILDNWLPESAQWA